MPLIMTIISIRRRNSQIEGGFSLIELLVLVAVIAVLASILLPSLAKSKAKAQGLLCQNNLRQVGVGLRVYSTDNQDRLVEAVFSDIYGTEHPVGNIREPGGARQWLLPDRLKSLGLDPRTYVCSGLRVTADVTETGKYLTSGSYDYLCGHVADPSLADVNSGPLRLFLAYYGPSGIERNGDGSDIETPERFFACGQEVSTFEDPSNVAVSICDSFGVHRGGEVFWERGFLPPPLGGSGTNIGVCTTAFADGHVELVRGRFEQVMTKLGITEPRKERVAQTDPD